MVFTRKTIKNLTGGVSQQPDAIRSDNQCTEQVNFLSDPVLGLTRRPGLLALGSLGSDGNTLSTYAHDSKNIFTHLINRSKVEQNFLGIGYWTSGGSGQYGGTVELSNALTGAQVAVATTDATTGYNANLYLTVSDVDDQRSLYADSHPYSAVTIADHTFVVNKTVIPVMKETLYGQQGVYDRPYVKRGLLFVKEGAYNANYTATMTDSEGTTRTVRVDTSDGLNNVGSGQQDGADDAKTDNVAGALHYGLQNQANNGVDFEMSAGDFVEENTDILVSWKDDSTTYVCNSASNGSDVEKATISMLAQPTFRDVGGNEYNYFVMFNALANVNPWYFQFGVLGTDFDTDIGASGQAGLGATIAVAIGAHVHETAQNLVDAMNSVLVNVPNVDYGYHAHVDYDEGTSTPIIVLIKNQTATNHFVFGTFNVTNVLPVGTSRTDGANTSGVDSRIRFQRKGSTIAWYAFFGTEAEAKASSVLVELEDSYGDTMTSSFASETETFAGLPVVAPNDFLIKIEGAPESLADDYYVRFVPDNPTTGQNHMAKGSWEESLASGSKYQIDAETMPHTLVKQTDGTYKFGVADWDDKQVGDKVLDPHPSFIGERIRDLFFFKSRLGFLAGESVIMSELDNPYNFWRTTTTQVLATDRIDISSSVNEITRFNFAVPFSNQLLIFSDRTQFLVNYGTQGLTPMSASVDLIGRYDCSDRARPVVNNSSIVFAQSLSRTSSVYEMYPTGTTALSFEAKEISEQLSGYISGDIINIDASSLAGAVVIQTDVGDNSLYVYKYYDKGRDRVVSSWSRYELAVDQIKGVVFVGDVLKLVTQTGNNGTGAEDPTHNAAPYMTQMRFDNTDPLTHAADFYYTILDSAVSYDASDGYTKITLPFFMRGRGYTALLPLTVFNQLGVVQTPHSATTGMADNKVAIAGDLKTNYGTASGSTITVGFNYVSKYTFSDQYLKRGSKDGKEIAITDGRTTVKWAEFYLTNTQRLDAKVTFDSGLNKSDSAKTFAGTVAGGAVLGNRESESDLLRIHVGAKNNVPTITIESSTHETATITGASFELMHTSRLSRTN